MPYCGSQTILCDVPINFDTYKGCTFRCSYCFTQRKRSLSKAGPHESVGSLRNFIEGRRDQITRWADWDIPIHWGAMADPFQHLERVEKRSLACLELLAETQYPVIVSTKSLLPAEEPWLSLIARCNLVFQMSMVHPDFDEWEPGAPNFDKRMAILPVMAKAAKRVIVRVQPYVIGYVERITHYLPEYRDAGVHGFIFEGLKRPVNSAAGSSQKLGMEKVGADFVFPTERLAEDFRELRERIHEHGMQFYAGENRLRFMGDSPTCCGVADLPGFRVNTANMNHLPIVYTEQMQKPDTAMWAKAMAQNQMSAHSLRPMSYKDAMEVASHTKGNRVAMGLSIDEKDPK
jgi:DNA repair photolyase